MRDQYRKREGLWHSKTSDQVAKLLAQAEVDRFRKEYPEIQEKTTNQGTWDVYFEGQCEEMIERPMIWTVLKTPADQGFSFSELNNIFNIH